VEGGPRILRAELADDRGVARFAVDSFASLDDGPEVESRVSGSRFLAQAFGVASEEASFERLESVRRRYHDATHHCWAHRVGEPGAVAERSDDDGEPAGTAGAPLLGALRSLDLFDALIVVTRWFGGTKLGTGGLIRAYGAAARDALAAAGTRTVWRVAALRLECSWEDVGLVEIVLSRAGRRIYGCDRVFGEVPSFRVTVLRSEVERLTAEIVEATGNRARVAPA